MKVKQSAKDLAFIIFGSILVDLAFSIFVIPNSFVSGGVGGLAIITNHFTSWPVGLLILLYNVPIMIWARRELNPRFIVYTIIAVGFQSLLLTYTNTLVPYTNDVLLASIFGGILFGVGGGLIIKQYGSSGGVDVIAIVLRKKLGISLGTVSSIASLIVISLATFIYGLEPGMYTIVCMLVSGLAMDLVQEGLNKKHTAMIVSNQSQEIKEAIMYQLHRGVTLMHGAGGFDSAEKDIIFCVVNQFELAGLKELVSKIDSQAFMTISEATEVMGRFSEHSFLWKKEK